MEVKFVPGRKAVLTIYDDGVEREKITLSNYKTKPDMHKLMVEKGFERMSEEEIQEMRDLRTGKTPKKKKNENEFKDLLKETVLGNPKEGDATNKNKKDENLRSVVGSEKKMKTNDSTIPEKKTMKPHNVMPIKLYKSTTADEKNDVKKEEKKKPSNVLESSSTITKEIADIKKEEKKPSNVPESSSTVAKEKSDIKKEEKKQSNVVTSEISLENKSTTAKEKTNVRGKKDVIIEKRRMKEKDNIKVEKKVSNAGYGVGVQSFFTLGFLLIYAGYRKKKGTLYLPKFGSRTHRSD